MTSTIRRGARRRTRLVAVPLALAFALSGLVACGSESADDSDESGGDRVTVVLSPGEAATPEQLSQARQILERRLELAGVEKDTVRVEGDRIVVSAPTRYRELLDGIGESGRMEFRPVLVAEPTAGNGGSGPSPSPSPSPSASGRPAGAPDISSGRYAPRVTPPPVSTPPPFDVTASDGSAAPTSDLTSYGVTPEMTAAFGTLDCADTATADRTAATASAAEANTAVLACDKPKEGSTERFVLGPAGIDGTDLSGAQAQLPGNGQVGGWEVSIEFNASGAAEFTRITGDLAAGKFPTNRFAAVVDGRVIVAPTVMQELSGGKAVITGNFTSAEAKRLAAVLRGGMLPVHLTVVSTTEG